MKRRKGIKKKTARRLVSSDADSRKAQARPRQRPPSDQDRKNIIEHLRRELDEALEQQGATAEVLNIISSFPGELGPVFQTILANATRICGAKFGTLYLREEGGYRAAAFHNAPKAFVEAREGRLIPPTSGSTFGRTVATKQPTQVLDSTKADAYRQGDPFVVAGAQLGGYRTIVSVPMLKEGELVGVISIYRQEVKAFTDKQIELVSNFAAQAVIAIENARLLDELRESLQQQTATANVLKVISSSPDNLEPVFQSILQNATEICQARFGTVNLYDGDVFRTVGLHNPPTEFLGRHGQVIRPHPESGLAKVVRTKQVVQIDDIRTLKPYREGNKAVVELADLAGARTLLIVPMLKKDELIGTFSIYRQEIRPFTEKQIELASSFAAQAVIAIENVRLLNELRESLQQQTATADVLKVISRSTFDLQTVLNTLVESVTRLCDADHAWLFERDGEILRWRASFGHATEVHSQVSNYFRNRKVPIDRSSVAGRTVFERKVVHLQDVLADPEYTWNEPQKIGGYRAALGIPLLREGKVAGVLFIAKTVPQLFAEKQIELATTFADQAVIAIENTRLFSELQDRTDDLSESLQQQTATAEVLRVISSSPTNIQPILDAILETAGRLCESEYAMFFRFQDGKYHLAGSNNAKAEYVQYLSEHPISIDGGSIVGRTALERRVVHIPDCLADPEYTSREYALVGKHRSMLGVPLLRDGAPVGVISLLRTTVKPYTDKQIELVTTFADQAVIAIENVRLFDEVQARTRDLSESLQQQTATADVLKVLSRSTFDLQTVLDTLAESVARLCEAFDSVIMLRHGDMLRARAHHGPIRMDFNEWPIGRGWATGRAFVDRVPIHIHDLQAAVDEFPDGGEMALRLGHRTILAVPLLREGEAVGALAIRRTEVKPFTEKQIELVETFADQAVIAIENVRLFDEVQARTRDLSEALEQQTATSEVLKVISSSLNDLNPVFETIGQRAEKLCEAEISVISMVDGDLIRLVSINGIAQEGVEAVRRAYPMRRDNETVTARAIRSGTICHVPDVLSDALYQNKDAARASGFRGCLAVPMIRDGQVVGGIFVARRQAGLFADAQVQLLKTFADQAVIAIENVRLFNETKEALDRQTATADVLKVISRSTFDLQTVLQTLVESAARLCNAEQGTITRQVDGVFYRAATHGFSSEFTEMVRDVPVQIERGSATGRALVERKIIHIPDVLADADYTFDEAIKLGRFRTVLAVPMLREGAATGVLTLTRKEVRPFGEKQFELVTTFADQAAIAIENARLFDEVQKRTEELSESLHQQTATSDVLKVISRSTFDLQTVLDTLVESAARLCEADMASINREADAVYRQVASYGFSPEFQEYMSRHPIAAGKGSVVGRAIMDGATIHIPDVLADPEYQMIEAATIGGAHTMLGVPLLREGVPIGVILLQRKAIRPFTDKQVELVETFADQAVIAIENVRLFNSVEARTRELAASLENLRTAQDRLVQTEKLASLGQLTAGIAHEIKNPLNFVNNFSGISAELIDELQETLSGVLIDEKTRAEITELTDTLRGNLEKVVQHGRRADSIVKNMLLHSRSGSGDHRPVEINAVVEESLNLAYHGARAETQGFNITLQRSFDPGAGEVDVFPQEITRVLLNLISNGFYAATKRKSQPGADGHEPTLAAATRNLGDRVEIRIRDNGTGISPDVKDKMFNPFFTTKPAGEGTGLGLSISHDIIVKQHAGSIEVDTQPGEFTEFRIILPRTAASLGKSGASV